MANRESLQKALNANYDLAFFRQNVLEPVFGSSLTIYSAPKPELVNPSEGKTVASIKQYGEVKLTDYRQLYLYEVALAENVIVERNKVSIGAVIKRLIAGNNAVLVNFYYPHQTGKSWRLSFIAKDQVIDDGEIKKTETHPKRYSYVLGPHESCRTAADRFAKLSLETDFTAGKLKEAFSVEKLSEKFFEDYKYIHYSGLIQYITGERIVRKDKKDIFEKVQAPSNLFKAVFLKGKGEDDAKKDVRDFVKKLLGRIVFLSFVQKKGWLGASDERWTDGDTNFLQNLFKTSGEGEVFYHQWLQKLFYDTLNNPHRPGSEFKLPDGKAVKIPYLNGGLFENDDPVGILTFPPKLFADLFEFFNQYNFTIYEDSPDDHTVAVDPEMLGHIFENLLEDNKDKGAFYTPKEIVHYMCQESLIEYLSTKLNIQNAASYQELGKPQTDMFGNEARAGQLAMMQGHKTEQIAITREDVERFIKHKEVSENIIQRAKEINLYLDELKICDPAIGSGAFPMGLLHEIFDAKQLLHQHCHGEGAFKAAEVKQNIIQNSIYGVDIEKGAVDIARLRFWLSLIVDEDLPRPLPNLDYKIVVGDSLLPKFEGEVVDIDWDTKSIGGKEAQAVLEKIQKGLNEIVEKQKQYFDAPEKDKMSLKAEIRNLKIDLLINQLTLDKIKYSSKNAITQDMFEKPKKDKVKELEILLRLKGFENNIKKLEQLKTQPDKPLQFFDWKLDFPEIMNPAIAGEKAGFDIAIGNPPYFNVNNVEKDIYNYLSKRYKEIHTGYNDIVYYFMYLGIELLKETGCCTLITSNYYLGNEYAKKLRAYLKNLISKIINFKGHMVFDTASVHTCISISQKKAPSDEIIFFECTTDKQITSNDIEAELSSFAVKRSELKDNWIVADQSNTFIFEKLKQGSVLLGEIAIIEQGSKSGKNDIFTISGGFAEETKMEATVLRKNIKNGDIDRYLVRDRGNVLIYVDNNTTIEHFPNVYSYLKKHKEVLSSRNEVKQGLYPWFRFDRPRNKAVFDAHEKIVVPYRAENNRFAYDDKQYFNDGGDIRAIVINNSNFNIRYVLAILNSRLIDWFYGFIGKPKGKAREYFNTPLSLIPIKQCSLTDQQPFITLVDQILAAKTTGTVETGLKPVSTKNNVLIINADTTALEKQIDEMVYKLYDLTPEEVAVVEGNK